MALSETISKIRSDPFNLFQGSHIAGFAGAYLDGEVGQIFGLDPAGPMFTKLTVQPEDERLDPSDAQFVQGLFFHLHSLYSVCHTEHLPVSHSVIHTDKTFIGAQIALGHQDFYPNVK